MEGRPLRSVLVSRLRYLGDVIMTTPVLEILKRGDPQLRLGYLAEWSHGRILQGHPHLDRLHLLRTRRRGADARRRSRDREGLSALAVLRELREADYDLALDLFFNPRSSWLLRLAGIPRRIAGTAGSRRHLFTHTVRPSTFPPEQACLLAAAPGGLGEHLGRLAPLRHRESGLDFLDYFHTHGDPAAARPFLPRHDQATEGEAGPGFESGIVLAPGATWPSKEWPWPHWRRLAEALADETDTPVRVLQPPGREEEFSVVEQWDARGRIVLLPPLDLPEVSRLLARSALLVTVDGGIMHLSVGLGVPTVALFGPTDPALWFPYQDFGPYRVLATRPHCAPCPRHHCDEFICLPDLSPESVLATVRELRQGEAPGNR